MNPDKIIFTDIDGVILDWSSNLPFYLNNMGMKTDHIVDLLANGNTGEAHWSPKSLFPESESDDSALQLLIGYCQSPYMATLSSWMDSLKVVNQLVTEGYKFVGITALTNDELSVARRKKNIDALFPSAFLEVVHVGVGQSKEDAFIELFGKYGVPLCYVDDRLVHLNEYSRAVEKFGKTDYTTWEFNLVEHTLEIQPISDKENMFTSNSWFDIKNKIDAIKSLVSYE